VSDVDLRPYEAAADKPAVLDLLAASLGWLPDQLHRAFFEWKHEQNPFGPSKAWVAVDGARIVAFRTFLEWRFDTERGPVRGVRAVDTATHPDYQGRGLFRRLTLHALEELRREGVAFVFNTPNAQSLPGYLRMGWKEVGRPPVAMRPRSFASLTRTLRARTAASRWGEAASTGEPAPEVLAERDAVDELLASQPRERGVRTARSAEFLAWRYGFEPLAYRALTATRDARDGFAIFRLRARGPALEAVVCDVLVPGGDPKAAAALAREVAIRSGADHAIMLGASSGSRSRYIPLPRQGPLLVWRSVCDEQPPLLRDWRLCMGDIELF